MNAKLFMHKLWQRVTTGQSSIETGCPKEAEMLAYREGTLLAGRQRGLEAHFSGCRDCRELLSLYIQVSESITDLPELSAAEVAAQTARIRSLIAEDDDNVGTAPVIKFRPSPMRAYWQYAAAVVAMCIVGVAVYFLVSQRRSPEERAWIALASALQTERQIEPRLAGAFPWSEYQATRGAETSSTAQDTSEAHRQRARNELRFAEQSDAPMSARLLLAKTYLASGYYQESLRAQKILLEIEAQGQASAECLNDLGITYFITQDFTKALSYFTAAYERDPHLQEALFNRALTLIRLNRLADSQEVWRQVIAQSTDEKWGAEAQKILKNLENLQLR